MYNLPGNITAHKYWVGFMKIETKSIFKVVIKPSQINSKLVQFQELNK